MWFWSALSQYCWLQLESLIGLIIFVFDVYDSERGSILSITAECNTTAGSEASVYFVILSHTQVQRLFLFYFVLKSANPLFESFLKKIIYWWANYVLKILNCNWNTYSSAVLTQIMFVITRSLTTVCFNVLLWVKFGIEKVSCLCLVNLNRIHHFPSQNV